MAYWLLPHIDGSALSSMFQHFPYHIPKFHAMEKQWQTRGQFEQKKLEHEIGWSRVYSLTKAI
jgi:hypothetical protein